MRPLRFILVLACLLCSAAIRAQSPATPPATDPLMSLMLTQPRIDTESPVVAAATFEPAAVHPGESATYRVVFNALEESVEWPQELAAPAELRLRAGAHGQTFQLTATNMQPRTTFLYRARPAREGTFTIPEFTVTVYGQPVKVPATHLTVAATLPEPLPGAPILYLEFPRTNLFAGQPVRARVQMPASPGGVLQFLSQVQIVGTGLIVDQSSASQRVEPVRRGQNLVTTVVYEVTAIPISAGKLTAFAQGYTVGNRVIGGGSITITGPAIIPGGPMLYTLLDSDPVELQVQPLPVEGNLPGFTGAVGAYSVEAPTLATNVLKVGDPVKLTARIRGQLNLARLVPPPPPKAEQWQVLPVTENLPPPQIQQAQGFTTFTYTLVPLTEAARSTPPIPYSCFDPNLKSYVDLTIPPVAVTVLPGSAPGDLNVLQRADAAGGEVEKEPELSSLASAPGLGAATLVPMQQRPWFPLVAAAPAFAFAALWIRERRRQYLLRHPEIVLCRRARRALRRERRTLREAAAAKDAPRFVASGVKALRIVAAPFYPAEPRALVSGDVLPLLPDEDRAGRPGEMIRRFFASADATQFGHEADHSAELLARQTELERLLDQMEERLCA